MEEVERLRKENTNLKIRWPMETTRRGVMKHGNVETFEDFINFKFIEALSNTSKIIDEKIEDGQKVKYIRDNSQVKPFLVMYGYTNDATDLINGNENWVHKLSSSEEKNIVPTLEKVWTVKEGKKTKNMTLSGRFTDYYKGMVAIPYRAEASAIIDAMVGKGPMAKPQTIETYNTNLLNSGQPITGSTSSYGLYK